MKDENYKSYSQIVLIVTFMIFFWGNTLNALFFMMLWLGLMIKRGLICLGERN